MTRYQVLPGIEPVEESFRYCLVSLSNNMVYLWDVASFCQVLLVSPGYVRYCEGSKKHVGDLVPNGDFLVLNCLGMGSSVSGIRSN